ncbi:chemotaxis protein CheC [Marinitoga hydrogenitolerans DSM 16785]|uniref:Chemotaxis protein CheC n=1 Tax=Marinitoga hydrogenitolerans (strain DSM 16785 / JCM 12826 / AT1271) TaxID=1122195 RepID=A0A1M4X5I3_MARH1|nr:chemotaxis protein CheC [Marinitoga hydrogenitolerans]SHE88452.1 chemotaxis protein CheC [Marinitoga hydrogenitolerans DSM 16785]
MNNENFEFFMSAFKEITNIGMGNAVSSLSVMLNKKVDISVPNLDVIKLSDIFLNMEEPDEIYACSYVKMQGDLDSSLVFLIEKDSVKRLIKESVGIEIQNITELDEMSTSMIGELGNIMFGSYTSAISQFLNINLQVTPPQVAVDTFASLIAESIVMSITFEDEVILTETEIQVEDWENVIKGKIVFLMNEENRNKLFEYVKKVFYGG